MFSSDDEYEILHLTNQNELHFSLLKPGQKISLELLDGSAEIFGSHLHINKHYEFSYFSSVTAFTESGCTLKIRKSSKQIKCKIKASEEIPRMRKLHEYLESFRQNAQTNDQYCPITLITGPTDVGKSTLCRYLTNYAAAFGRAPILIDLDVGQSSISIPGTFGVLRIYEASDTTGKFNEQTLSVYYFGYKSPGHNMMLYKLLLEKVGKCLQRRLIYGSSSLKSSGVIIDTCGWVNGQGYTLIMEIIKALEVNIIFVVGDNSLYSKLRRDLSSRNEITFVSELNVSCRDKTIRGNNRNSSVYEYFYGPKSTLKPCTFKVHFTDLHIYQAQITKKKNTGNSVSSVILVPIEPSILNQVLGLSYAEQIEDILLTSVYGFICLVELDMDSEVAKVLSPRPGPLPSKYLLMGDIMLETESQRRTRS